MKNNTSNLIPEPNYTQIPNVIFDYWMPRLRPTAFTVLMCLCRKIFGWHKTSDKISKNQIMKATGMSKNTVQVAVEELENHGLVLKFQNKNENGQQPNTYALNIEKPQDNLYQDPVEVMEADQLSRFHDLQRADQNLGGGRSKFDLGVGQNLTGGVGQNLTPQKKDITKERHTKERSEKERAPSFSKSADDLCEYLSSSLKSKLDYAGKITLQHKKDAENLLEVHKLEELKEVIDWCMAKTDNFWPRNILSTSKLLGHIDTIKLQKKTDKPNKASKTKLANENKKLADKIDKKYSNKTKYSIHAGATYLEIQPGGNHNGYFYKYEEPNFKENALSTLIKLGLNVEGL